MQVQYVKFNGPAQGAWTQLSLHDSCLQALCLLCCDVESCHYYNCKKLTDCLYTDFQSWGNKNAFTQLFLNLVYILQGILAIFADVHL